MHTLLLNRAQSIMLQRHCIRLDDADKRTQEHNGIELRQVADMYRVLRAGEATDGYIILVQPA